MIGFAPAGTAHGDRPHGRADGYAAAVPRSPRRPNARDGQRFGSDLVRALLHEVGNLLAAARMSGHFLGTELTKPERAAMSRDVERLTSQAAALLGQMRPLTEGASDRRTRVKVAAVLHGLASAVEGAMPDDRFRVASGRGLPEVRVDAGALQHVLVALATAAVGDSKPGGRVRVTARAEGARVILAVIDEAPGIELPAEASRALRGRELGLMLADAILRTMGARVRMAPRRRGNQVELLLPAVRTANGGARRPRAGRGAPRRP